MKRPFFLFVLLSVFLLADVPPAVARTIGQSESSDLFDLDINEYDASSSEEVRWFVMPAVFGGYNQLLKGYPDYTNLGNVGLEVWVQRETDRIAAPEWYTNNFLTRLSAEWLPLQVPKDNYGLTEDMYALTGQIVYKFDGDRSGRGWIPLLGLGAGGYWDRLTLDTPATGKITGTHYFFGLNASVGMFLPSWGSFRPVVEARYHRLKGPDKMWPQHVTYQVGLIYGLGSR